ncbi:MAG: hypothetical protein R3B69_04170 [Candidatus Paceibacterota bacterium]
MNIQDLQEKSKRFIGDDALFSALLVILVGVASFGLGRQSAVSAPASVTSPVAEPIHHETVTPRVVESGSTGTAETANTQYVASKNSNKYHLPWCSGAQRIAEANKIYFSSKAEAEAAGYQPAANCKGI